jgi:hypothetical protein
MKRLLLGIALLACLPLFAQDQPNRDPRNNFTIYRQRSGYRIFVFGDQVNLASRTLEFVDRNAGTCQLRLTGNVEVTTQDAVLEADEADYRCRAGEIGYDIEPRGNVHLTVFPKQ